MPGNCAPQVLGSLTTGVAGVQAEPGEGVEEGEQQEGCSGAPAPAEGSANDRLIKEMESLQQKEAAVR